jgi:hypothetical protein
MFRNDKDVAGLIGGSAFGKRATHTCWQMCNLTAQSELRHDLQAKAVLAMRLRDSYCEM